MLDTYSIHEGVNAERFDAERVLELVPPDGHFALMNYRSSRSFRPPFRVYPMVEDDAYAGDKVGGWVIHICQGQGGGWVEAQWVSVGGGMCM